ncbi:MAG: hypothetical protein R3C53_01440 [Pirellulaceae bacterium]
MSTLHYYFRGLLPLAALLLPIHLKAQDPLSALDAAASDVRQAAVAAQELQARDDLELTSVLASMKDKSAVAKNWYLSVAQSIADRHPDQTLKELQQFLPRLSEDSTARYWAFSYLTRKDDQLREQILESMLADPCLELRYEAVALRLERLDEAKQLSDQERLGAYRELLAAARLPSQVQEVAKHLEELGQDVNLLKHFGFLTQWQTVGPFNNVGQVAFDLVYPPEQDYLDGELDAKNAKTLSKAYPGKENEVTWQAVSTDKEDGAIDLNVAYDNAKGAVVYALGAFTSTANQPCEVRIGSSNAVKVWVNGQLLINREVYHAGATQIDQYVAPVQLKAGVNSILVKVSERAKGRLGAGFCVSITVYR